MSKYVLAVCLVAIASVAWAQSEPEKPEPELQFRLFRLEHAPAESALKVVEHLAGDNIRLTCDTRTNTVAARGDKAAMAVVEQLLLELDRPAAAPPTTTLRTRRSPTVGNALQQKYEALEQQIDASADRCRVLAASKDKNARQKLDAERKDLLAKISSAFELRQQIRRAEVDQLKKRLQAVESTLNDREQAKQEITASRLQHLLDADRDPVTGSRGGGSGTRPAWTTRSQLALAWPVPHIARSAPAGRTTTVYPPGRPPVVGQPIQTKPRNLASSPAASSQPHQLHAESRYAGTRPLNPLALAQSVRSTMGGTSRGETRATNEWTVGDDLLSVAQQYAQAIRSKAPAYVQSLWQTQFEQKKREHLASTKILELQIRELSLKLDQARLRAATTRKLSSSGGATAQETQEATTLAETTDLQREQLEVRLELNASTLNAALEIVDKAQAEAASSAKTGSAKNTPTDKSKADSASPPKSPGR